MATITTDSVKKTNRDRSEPVLRRDRTVIAAVLISIPVGISQKRIRIDMSPQLLYGLRILGGRKGVTQVILRMFHEYVSIEAEGEMIVDPDYTYKYELLLQQLNNYCPQFVKKSKVKIKSFHMMVPSLILERLRHLASGYMMDINDFFVQILAEKMIREVAKNPGLLMHYMIRDGYTRAITLRELVLLGFL